MPGNIKNCMLCPNPLEGEFLSGEHIILSAIVGCRESGDVMVLPTQEQLLHPRA